MSSTSNFRKAMQEVQGNQILGPNVISNALPYVGGGLVLTAVGTYGGLGVMASRPDLFMPTFFGAMIVQLILFFVAQGVIQKQSNSASLPLLALFGLLTGYTLSGIVALALNTSGVGIGGVGIAAFGCGVTFILGRNIGSNLSDEDGLALAQTVRLGVIALLVVIVGELLLSVFGIYTPGWLEVGISGIGVALFVGVAVVDFYIMPRTYEDEQYLPVALSMYLTYINLFVFILRFLIAMNSRD